MKLLFNFSLDVQIAFVNYLRMIKNHQMFEPTTF